MKTSCIISGKKILSGVLIALAFASISIAAPEKKSIATVTIPATPEQYAVTPQPLAVSQCAQCHTDQYRNLKDDGKRHRFACQKCHTLFHAYNPRKGNWDALMPKCSSCHDAPHGPKVVDCAACHSNPHAPRKIAANAPIANVCFDCHGSVRDQLVKFPSKHSKVPCMSCHTSHGLIPTCVTCHTKPHASVNQATCLQCHPVHRPLQISLSKDVPSTTCGSCHTKVFGKLTANKSKHSKVACVTCHKDKHGYIPKCTDCHGLPHKKMFHDKFPRCLTCHVDVHDLPAMP